MKEQGYELLTLIISKFYSILPLMNLDNLSDVIAELSDIFENCPQTISFMTKTLMDCIYKLPKGKKIQTVRNACFTSSRMHYLASEVMEPFVESSLWFYLDVSKKSVFEEEKDNAVAAIIRVYLVDKKQQVPQAKVAVADGS